MKYQCPVPGATIFKTFAHACLMLNLGIRTLYKRMPGHLLVWQNVQMNKQTKPKKNIT